MFQEMLLKKLIKSKVGNIPDSEIDKIIKIVKENPSLFEDIARDVDAKIKAGESQESALREVLQNHADDLKKLS